MLGRILRAALVASALLSLSGVYPGAAQAPREFELAGGRFYTAAGNGIDSGFAITDADGVLFYTEFQRMGGVAALGYPISERFTWDGFTTQALQKAILQWQPGAGGGKVFYVNVFDELSRAGRDGWLSTVRSTPPPSWLPGEDQMPFDERVQQRLGWLDANPALRAAYFRPADPISIYGLPASPVTDLGSVVVARLQRAVIQQWKVDVPWAKAGEVTVANGGDVAKEAGLLPPEPLVPRDFRTGRPVATPSPAPSPATTPRPPATPVPTPNPDRIPLDILRTPRPRVVALDAGHGGADPGASARYPDGSRLDEKTLTLQVVQKTAALLRDNGFQVVLTRTSDAEVNSRRLDLNGDGEVNWRDDLQARIDIANSSGAEALISVHFNGFTDPEVRGTEVYYNRERMFAGDNRRLAALVMDSLFAAIYRAGYRDTNYRGAKPDTDSPGEEHYFLLGAADGKRIARASNMPAVIGEALFLTNARDADYLRQPAMLDAIAQGYAAAVSRFFAPTP